MNLPRGRSVLLDRLLTLATVSATVGAVVLLLNPGPRGSPIADAEPVATRINHWRQLVTRGTLVGSRDAPVTIVVFRDFGCPSCREVESFLLDQHERFPNELAIVFPHFPLNEVSHRAALVYECAVRQGMGREMSGTLYRSPKELSRGWWTELGVRAGVQDTATLARCMDNPQVHAIVQADIQAADSLYVRETPTLVVNGVLFESLPTREWLAAYLKSAIRKQAPAKEVESR